MPDRKPEHDDAAPAQVAGDTPPSDDLRALLERERQERAKREREIADMRSNYDRNLARKEYELQQARRAVRTAPSDAGFDGGEPMSQSGSYEQRLRDEIAALRAEQGYIRFRQDYPAAAEFWTEIDQLVKDPSQAPLVASFLPGTEQPDIYSTLRNAYREVRVRRMEKSATDSEAQRRKLDEDRAANRRAATISGTAAAGTEEPPDISKMSAAEMLESGLLNDMMDPDDPIRLPPRRK